MEMSRGHGNVAPSHLSKFGLYREVGGLRTHRREIIIMQLKETNSETPSSVKRGRARPLRRGRGRDHHGHGPICREEARGHRKRRLTRAISGRAAFTAPGGIDPPRARTMGSCSRSRPIAPARGCAGGLPRPLFNPFWFDPSGRDGVYGGSQRCGWSRGGRRDEPLRGARGRARGYLTCTTPPHLS